MNKHYGQVVEKVIRRNGYSISELARSMEVNRRSVYNWFNQKRLNTEIIHRIAGVLNHDFSNELPELFTAKTVVEESGALITDQSLNTQQINLQTGEAYWKDKYIVLLERYNELLAKKIEMNTMQTNKIPTQLYQKT